MTKAKSYANPADEGIVRPGTGPKLPLNPKFKRAPADSDRRRCAACHAMAQQQVGSLGNLGALPSN